MGNLDSKAVSKVSEKLAAISQACGTMAITEIPSNRNVLEI